MFELIGRGCFVQGLEIDPRLVGRCRQAKLSVAEGDAEQLPFADSTFDGVVSSVVLPYTDERKAVAEIARVLKAGGWATICCHGVGYGLRYLMESKTVRDRFYGLRMLLNGFWYRRTSRRLPGWLGDTLVQTPNRMRRYYRQTGLEICADARVGSKWGFPIFICHQIVKSRTDTA